MGGGPVRLSWGQRGGTRAAASQGKMGAVLMALAGEGGRDQLASETATFSPGPKGQLAGCCTPPEPRN